MNKSILGLDKTKSANIVYNLNGLLANFQIYYQNLRGLHWNIKGKNFFELHVKFEEFYTDSQVKIDNIAERILTLQGNPLHTFIENATLGLSYSLTDKTFLSIGSNIGHVSNLDTQKPNNGYSFVGFEIGISYLIKQ